MVASLSQWSVLIIPLWRSLEGIEFLEMSFHTITYLSSEGEPRTPRRTKSIVPRMADLVAMRARAPPSK
jgi:hypothetical protein